MRQNGGGSATWRLSLVAACTLLLAAAALPRAESQGKCRTMHVIWGWQLGEEERSYMRKFSASGPIPIHG